MKNFGAALFCTLLLLAACGAGVWWRADSIVWEAGRVSAVFHATQPDPVWDFADHVFAAGYGLLAAAAGVLFTFVYGLLCIFASYFPPASSSPEA